MIDRNKDQDYVDHHAQACRHRSGRLDNCRHDNCHRFPGRSSQQFWPRPCRRHRRSRDRRRFDRWRDRSPGLCRPHVCRPRLRTRLPAASALLSSLPCGLAPERMGRYVSHPRLRLTGSRRQPDFGLKPIGCIGGTWRADPRLAFSRFAFSNGKRGL